MKLLIVDDSQAMRNIIKWNLNQSEVHIDKVFEASCCKDALLIIETKKPDLVITDWNMPEMGGLQLLRELRETHNSVRFGFVTTQVSTSIHNIAKDACADFIVSNPSCLNTFKTQISQSL